MEVSTKELRMQPGRIIEYAADGHEVIVTYRGKAMVKIIPIEENISSSTESEAVFGLWKNHKDKDNVDEYIRNIRKGREF